MFVTKKIFKYCLACIIGAIGFSVNEVFAQKLVLDLGEASGISSRLIQILGLVTILGIAPSIMIMITSFTRIIVVLSIIRTALSLQQTPPNQVLTSLALFLTFFVMAPTFNVAYQDGIKPLIDNRITEEMALENIQKPFHKFMLSNVRPKELELFLSIGDATVQEKNVQADEDIPFYVLIPAFMISELKRAFEIGFVMFLPFLIIDIVVSAILMSMGMMMLPPVTIALPCKLLFFAMVDGWYLICGSIIKSYGIGL